MVGSHYNRCWIVYLIFWEALERLLLIRFLTEINPVIPDELLQLSADPENDKVSANLIEELQTLSNSYELFRKNARSGAIGKTAQFWMLYIDLMGYQVMAHTAVQENDMDTLIYCWKIFIPMYFAMNKTHYFRYVVILKC